MNNNVFFDQKDENNREVIDRLQARAQRAFALDFCTSHLHTEMEARLINLFRYNCLLFRDH